MSDIAKQPHQKELFGHPVGLYVLFFTEMWERFSYYGMRAILVYYIIASATGENPGLDWSEGDAYKLYGWYTMLVYVVSIFGGIIADKLIGQKKTVLYGGILLVAGHSILAIEQNWAFFTGLLLIILGVGGLKPNISTMVGGLYKQGDPRRDGGFTIFYIGINVGAFLSAIIVGAVGENYGWHYGFGLAGIGMFLGLITYLIGQKYLIGIGDSPKKNKNNQADSNEKADTSIAALLGNLLKSPLQLVITGIIMIAGTYLSISYSEGVDRSLWIGVSIFLGLVAGVLMMIYKDITKIEKDRFVVLLLSFLIVVVFWGAFEQAGGLMSVYTKNKIDRNVSLLFLDGLFIIGALVMFIKSAIGFVKKQDTKWLFAALGLIISAVYIVLKIKVFKTNPFELPGSVFQSVNALFIMIFGTMVGSFWVWWRRKGRETSSLFKMAIGTVVMGIGFLFMAKASMDIEQYGDKAALALLILAYLFHTLGELSSSPVSLSFITKVAPVKYVSLMMGVYFASTGFGNKVAGLIGESSQVKPVSVEFVSDASPETINQLIGNDTTFAKADEFDLVGKIKKTADGYTFIENGSSINIESIVKYSDGGAETEEERQAKINAETEKLDTYLSYDEEIDTYTGILTFKYDTKEHQKVKEGKAETTVANYSGELAIFEVQDDREYKTFIMIFLFTVAFAILVIIFLKKLKALTHGADEVNDNLHEEEAATEAH